ncbi:TrbC/VirB2 family protein [Paraburkholderia phosphatilytica]|uniref:TrbC/VirB2 family protein n=1 Tax=Paraburkholderia phosphatilytica TaxID=2282883 RepID=UPI000E51F0BC|nr:TrbC/VirB2 family protein [Paraburkholderia phosphatilytica]
MKSGLRKIFHGKTTGAGFRTRWLRTWRVRLALSVLALPVLGLPVAAHAELSQVSTLLTTIQSTLLGVGSVVCSISIIWAGFKMMFQHARFGDIANVFIGGLFVGCATVIAAMLISSS